MSSGSGMDTHEAAFSGDIRMLRKLLDECGEVNSVNEKDHVGQIPLHKAAMNGWYDCVCFLVNRGAAVNTGDVSGCTPLHYAAGNGYLQIVQFLVQSGNANVHQKSNKGRTAKCMAKSRGQTRIVAFFNELDSSWQRETKLRPQPAP